MTDPDSTNPCSGCGTAWPLSERYYHRRAQTARGFQSRCRACRASDENRPLVLANMLAPEGHKVCRRCLVPKPADLDHFYRSGYKDTLRGHCKVCADAEARESRSDPDVKARLAQSRRERDARYYRENRDRIREDQRGYYRLNADAVKRSTRARYLKVRFTPKHRLKRRVEQSKRRAALRGAEGSFTVAEVLRMVEDQGGACAYCERALEGDFHADHMTPLSKGGANDWTNLAVACPLCNLSKYTRTAEEFMEEIRSR